MAPNRGCEDEEPNICPCCGGRMVIVQTFEPGCEPRLLAHPIARARQLMTTTLLPPPRITAPDPGRYPAGNGHAPPSQPSAPTPTAKTQIARRDIVVPIPSRPTDRNTALPAQPAPLFAIPRSDQIPAPNPHSLIPAPATTPPRFPPLRLFGRLPPYARLTPVSGRRPKTLNMKRGSRCEG